MHSSKPPVIHRDLKCDNIFISSINAEIRIGDLGLSTTLIESHLKSQVGTPYFMAPEMYEENYGSGVDIYSFGLCIIEMCTLTTPYSECKNQAALFHKIKNGEKPQAFHMISDEGVRDFISLCIQPANLRPRANELLRHEFFENTQDEELANISISTINTNSFKSKKREILKITTERISENIIKVSIIVKNIDDTKSLVNFDFNTQEEVPEKVAEDLVTYVNLSQESLDSILIALESKIVPQAIPLIISQSPEKLPEQQRTPSFHGKGEDRIVKFSIKLGIQDKGMLKKVSVEIKFDLDKDSVEEIAEYTVQELGLDTENYFQIVKLIKEKISRVTVNDLQSSYSYLDLLDIENDKGYILPPGIKNQANSTTESINYEIKSPQSYSSKNLSFELYGKSHNTHEDPFSGNLSPINSFVEVKTSPPKADEEDINSSKGSMLRGIISRKNQTNYMNDVKKLQEALRYVLDTKIKIDGIYSKKTEGKVKLFQSQHKLPVDGIVTQKVWEKIMSKR